MQGTFHALAGIVRQEGPSGLLRGLGPTVLTNAPFSALYYMFYSGLKRRLQPVRPPACLLDACIAPSMHVRSATAWRLAQLLLLACLTLDRPHPCNMTACNPGPGGRFKAANKFHGRHTGSNRGHAAHSADRHGAYADAVGPVHHTQAGRLGHAALCGGQGRPAHAAHWSCSPGEHPPLGGAATTVLLDAPESVSSLASTCAACVVPYIKPPGCLCYLEQDKFSAR